MTGGGSAGVILSPASLAALMPMHLHLDAAGMVRGAGATLQKIAATPLIGRDVFDLIRVHRPRGIVSVAGLLGYAGKRLTLALLPLGSESHALAEFRGHALPDGRGGVLMNLSFGIGVVDGVRQHGLTDADFAPTDLTVELLYLVEAKQAVLEEFRRLNRRLDRARTAAEERALTDALTGLTNRRGFDLALERACFLAASGGESFALLQLDLDRFKAVNDTHGHAAGDLVLTQVARVLREETRSGDTVARLGGDEFTLILSGMTDSAALARVAERIIQGVSRPITDSDAVYQIGTSIGIVASPGFQRPEPRDLMAAADEALYAAKAKGRGRWEMADAPDFRAE